MPLPLAPEAPPAEQLPSPFSNIAAGELPAVSFPPEKKGEASGPLSQYVQDNLPTLLAAGIDVFEAKDQHSVLFNPTLVSLEDLKKAEAAGTLLKVAPSIKTAKPAKTAPAAAAPLAAPAQPAAAPTGPLAQQSLPPAPMNPAPKPNGKLQAAQLQNMKSPNAASAANPLDQLSKRAI